MSSLCIVSGREDASVLHSTSGDQIHPSVVAAEQR